MQWRREDYLYTPLSAAPAVVVLNAFSSGGAQISGARTVDTVEISDDLDLAAGKHAVRTGFLFEGGRYHTDILRNATGTFTFASLTAYDLGLPTTYTRNAGNPNVEVSLVQSGV